MDERPTWTDCDEAVDYVVPNVLSPRDLVFRPDNMDETVPHNLSYTVHDHVNETLKIAEILVSVQSVGESIYNSEVLRCHPHVCRCIHVHFVLNYQNGMHRFSPKRTPRISIKKLYFAHLLILIIAFVVSTPI